MAANLSREREWSRTDCTDRPLDLSATLSSGQAFRWRRDRLDIWWGAIESAGVGLWQQEGDPEAPLYWQTFPEPGLREIVEEYLRLDVPLESLYAEWVRAEPRMREITRRFRGLRILRQPPEECFFSFQCATCNTVVKIQRTVHRLAERYGRPLFPPCESAAPPDFSARETAQPIRSAPPPIFTFPDASALSRANEADLRADLWGFRAPRLIALARHLERCGNRWLSDLRRLQYEEAKAKLVDLDGIGEKVADCICLFCLDKDEAVPVDTHVRQIACRLFLPDLHGKSLTPRVYRAIADAYRERFGTYAGWAQQYLFHDSVRHANPDRQAAK